MITVATYNLLILMDGSPHISQQQKTRAYDYRERWALAVSSVKCTEGSSHYHGMEAKCEHCRQDMNLCPNGAFLTLSPSSRSPCTACPEACATLLLVGGGAPPDDYIGDAGIAPSIDTKTSSCYFYGLLRKQSI